MASRALDLIDVGTDEPLQFCTNVDRVVHSTPAAARLHKPPKIVFENIASIFMKKMHLE